MRVVEGDTDVIEIRSGRSLQSAAAAEILQEAGWDAFNTNAVASRAGVSITAIYSYFPDKYAIVNEIFTRMSERRMVVMTPYVKALETQDLETTFFEGLKVIAQLRIDEPAGLTMRAIYQAVPELRTADREDDQRMSAALADVLRVRNPRLPILPPRHSRIRPHRP